MVRAAHNRSLDSDSERLWSKLKAQPISFEQQIELPPSQKRPARQTRAAFGNAFWCDRFLYFDAGIYF